MNDLILETIRGIVLAALCVYLWRAGRKRADLSRRGWKYILVGFGLLLFGSFLDITDNFEFLNRFVIIGDTEIQAVFEKLVGYLGGFIFLAYGLVRWIPTITSQEKLKQSEEMVRVVFDAIGDGVSVTDPKGNILDVNEAWLRMFAFQSKEEVLGIHISCVVAKEDFNKLEEQTDRVSQMLRGDIVEYTLRDNTGRTFEGETNMKAIFNEEGNNIGFVRVTRNVTERKLADAELALAKEAAEDATLSKSEFLANMSHEIRTPMTAILGFSEIVLANVSDQQSIDSLKTIQRNGEYLLELINDILDLAKIESGKLKIERIRCCPYKILSDMAALMRVQASAKGLPLEIESARSIPDHIHTDPTRLRQILINLVSNAVKFTEVGKVRIVARSFDEETDEPKIQFEIIDTGIGMSEEQIDNLFQPFVQADNSATRGFGGTGLGLTISKRLTEMLGGELNVSSTLGEGSIFSVTISARHLIRNGNKKKVTPKIKNKTPKKLPSNNISDDELLNCRVLFAEDGPDNQRLISFILKKAGADVTIAGNGKIALDLATAAHYEAKPYDVILMDMQMPVLDGYTATSELRKTGYHGPIIALTAHAMSSDRDKCLNAGCDDYLAKPVERKTLISLVSQYASRQRIAQRDN